MSKKALLAATIILIVLYILNEFLSGKAEQATRSHVKGTSAAGLSAFSELMVTTGIPHTIRKSPYFFVSELRSASQVWIAAPLFSLSDREVVTVHDYLKSGGKTLVVMVHAANAQTFADELFKKAKGVPPLIVEDLAFKNRKTTTAVAYEDTEILRLDEKYNVYSKWKFAGCKSGSADCYIRKFELNGSTVFLVLSLPLHSNYLMSQGDNRQLIFRLLNRGGPIEIDQFHVLFSDRSLAQLFAEPFFFFPVLFGLIFILCYFVFSRNVRELFTEVRKRVRTAATSRDEFNAGFIGTMSEHPSVWRQVPYQLAYFYKRLHPEFRDEMTEFEGQADGQSPNLERLSAKYRELLKRKGHFQ